MAKLYKWETSSLRRSVLGAVGGTVSCVVIWKKSKIYELSPTDQDSGIRQRIKKVKGREYLLLGLLIIKVFETVVCNIQAMKN